MIIDTLSNAGVYFGLHKNFKAAFEYLSAQNLETIATGTYQITDGVTAIITDKEAVSAAAQKFECHNKNIDIQLCISGNETMGWKPRTDCKTPAGAYSDENDVLFFNDTPDMYFGLKAGQFAIFYPNDVHAPMIGQGMIKKVVVKVEI